MATAAPEKHPSVPLNPLIGSGSPEEVERRVNVLLDMGTSRGYLTYEELNTKLPDEMVAPDRLDSLLMTIDEMGIKLIDESDVHEYQTKAQQRAAAGEAKKLELAAMPKIKIKAAPLRPSAPKPPSEIDPDIVAQGEDDEDDDEEVDLAALAKELAEAGTKRIDDPVRMYLTQMGEIPLLKRDEEISLAKKIESHPQDASAARCWRCDYCPEYASVDTLKQRAAPATCPSIAPSRSRLDREPGRQNDKIRPAHAPRTSSTAGT